MKVLRMMNHALPGDILRSVTKQVLGKGDTCQQGLYDDTGERVSPHMEVW